MGAKGGASLKWGNMAPIDPLGAATAQAFIENA